MFYTPLKDVYHWIKEMLSHLRQRIVGLFQRQK